MYAHVLVPVSFDTERDSASALKVARLLAALIWLTLTAGFGIGARP